MFASIPSIGASCAGADGGNMKRILYLLVALTTPAAAAPAYLKCIFPPEGFEVQVTADEANAAVTVFMPATGNTQKMNAVFTPTQVLFRNSMMSYELSRTDLSIIRTTPIIKSVVEGKCSVITAPKRAF